MAAELPSSEVADQPGQLPVLSSVQRFSGHVIDVRTDLVRMPDGAQVERDVVVHPGAVGVVVLDDRDRVLLIRQYRHSVGALLWEPPAGLLDSDAQGQSPYENAARELYEEAGFRAADWQVLVDYYTTPGGSNEALRLYLARGVSEFGEHERHVGHDEEADMPYSWVPLDEAVGKVLDGKLHNSAAVCGILATAAARARGFDRLRPVDAPWPERPGP